MAENEGSGDRTEEATPRRQEEARERGQVAKSRDLGAAISLLGAILLLKYGGHMIGWFFFNLVDTILGEKGMIATTLPPYKAEILPIAMQSLVWLAIAAIPFLLAVFFVAFWANYGQVGFLFTTQPLEPNLNKINPVAGFQRMFSLRSFITLTMSVLKISIMALAAWPMIARQVYEIGGLAFMSGPALSTHMTTTVTDLALRLACLLIILGIIDYAYQRYQHGQDLRMTKQQVKDEYRNTEGSPEIRQRRRQMQREIAMQRMMQEVPKADVVIRNPTHFAVALRYDADKHDVPILVAKGKDSVALKILDVARANKVFLWYDPPLARWIFRDVEIGKPVPKEMYTVIAHVLSTAYKVKGKQMPMPKSEKAQA